MRIRPKTWSGKALPVDEAVALQSELSREIVRQPLDVDAVQLVAGSDISFDKETGDVVYAGFVVLRLPDFEVVERAGVETTANFPYIPGLLSFREIPPLLQAWAHLKTRPDALIVDGQGVAHPRRFGIACHLGLELDLPTVGCAKSLLCGHFDMDALGPERGSTVPIVHRRETIGMALRTRDNVSPVFVSEGTHCDLASAVKLVERCLGKTRLPETSRLAHGFVNELRREAKSEQLGLPIS